MKRQMDAILHELHECRPVMLATIAARSGSAPRGVGTAMAVLQNGEMVGTVGGGVVEYRARQDALDLMRTGKCGLRSYEIHADEKGGRSGSVRILFRLFAVEAGISLASEIRDSIESCENRFLISDFGHREWETFVASGYDVCAKYRFSNVPETPIFGCSATGQEEYFIEPLLSEPRILLFGGGHVAQAMAKQLDLIGFRVWVVEDRAEFATQELFPTAERVLLSEYTEAELNLRISGNDHAIVMSRGHEQDYQILRWVLRSEAGYIGCIGSQKKIALTKERLLGDGITQAQFARLHAPIGLAIGAETPAEIAVSVAAELIAYRAKREDALRGEFGFQTGTIVSAGQKDASIHTKSR